MRRTRFSILLVAAIIASIPAPTRVLAQDTSELAGRWTLDREQSQFPREIGFNVDWGPVGGVDSGAGSSGGGGRRGSGGGGLAPSGFNRRPESQEEAKRLQQLTAEVREPSTRLTIVETPSGVTITNDRGQARTFHPDGRDDSVQLDGVSVSVIARRESGGLVILYKVEQGRELRYTYSHAPSPAQLIVDVEFLERGGGDKVRRVYQPASETETMVTAPPAPAPAATQPSASATDPSAKGVPATSGGQPETFNQQPDAQFKGLTKLGLVIEGIGQQATTCGLNQSTLETALSKRLSDAGLTVLHNTDEDTYVYVNIMTSSTPTGLCISRYDAYLYTYTTAKLSYSQTPVLVQVSLLHKGGLAGGNATAHAEQVVKGVQDYVDQFATRIRNANK